jgi:ankyrin repeat protein
MNNAYYSAKLLLENGADVTIENSDGSTAFNFVQSQEMKDLLTAEVLRLKKENQDLLKRIQDLQARGIM